MQQTFTLRKFVPDDLQNVMQINRVCLPENYTDFFFVDLHQRFPETFILAEENGKIAGYIMCRIEVGLSNFGLGGLIRKGHVVSIAVMPQSRRKGIASALITRALEGISLYKKLGFEITRTVNGYYSDGEDAYVMTKRV